MFLSAKDEESVKIRCAYILSGEDCGRPNADEHRGVMSPNMCCKCQVLSESLSRYLPLLLRPSRPFTPPPQLRRLAQEGLQKCNYYH